MAESALGGSGGNSGGGNSLLQTGEQLVGEVSDMCSFAANRNTDWFSLVHWSGQFHPIV